MIKFNGADCCATIPTTCLQNFSPCKTKTLYRLNSNTRVLFHQPLGPTIPLSVSVNLPFLGPHISAAMQCLSFSDWLIVLIIMSSQFIYVVP